jgi:hypothetical protein
MRTAAVDADSSLVDDELLHPAAIVIADDDGLSIE